MCLNNLIRYSGKKKDEDIDRTMILDHDEFIINLLAVSIDR